MNDVAVTSLRPVEDVREKQIPHPVGFIRCHIPWPVNVRIRERLYDFAQAVEHKQTTGLRGPGGAVDGRQAAHDYPTRLENRKRGRKADAPRTRPGKIR